MNTPGNAWEAVDWLDVAPSSSWQHRPQPASEPPTPGPGTASLSADGGGLAPGG